MHMLSSRAYYIQKKLDSHQRFFFNFSSGGSPNAGDPMIPDDVSLIFFDYRLFIILANAQTVQISFQ